MSQGNRWEQFTDAEIATIEASLLAVTAAIVNAAGNGEIDESGRENAAATLYAAGKLLYTISDSRGEERPSDESLRTTCRLIAEGTYAGMLAQAQAEHEADEATT